MRPVRRSSSPWQQTRIAPRLPRVRADRGTRGGAPLCQARTAGIAVLLGALCVASCSQPPPPPPVAATLLEPPLTLPEVSLFDKAGAEFTREQLNDRFNLLFFGFTHCPDICPLTLAVLARMGAEWRTPHIDVPQVVFVSVDPARDDPDRIDTYLGHFDPAFKGVTGPRHAMDPWLKALGVAVHVDPHADGEPYTVTHNSTVYVVGPGAELIAVFSPPHDAEVIAADFLRIRDHYLRTQTADPSATS